MLHMVISYNIRVMKCYEYIQYFETKKICHIFTYIIERLRKVISPIDLNSMSLWFQVDRCYLLHQSLHHGFGFQSSFLQKKLQKVMGEKTF